jgi:hypothetical protein
VIGPLEQAVKIKDVAIMQWLWELMHHAKPIILLAQS